MIKIGLDAGSTTVKLVAVDAAGNLLFKKYERHNAQVKEAVLRMLAELLSAVGDEEVSLRVTGSVALGLSERYGLPFVQEVVAAAGAVQKFYPSAKSMIDIGGEDAKIVFFKDGQADDLRMNGNCAGGTGAFIDQMAIILGVGVEAMNSLAEKATRVYPIASRCGVFCKTDIQNLVAKNVCREDIAASIFHAVAVQTVSTLAHGCDIEPPVLFCGGPLTFQPALRRAFADFLSLGAGGCIIPANGALLPATGAALAFVQNDRVENLSAIINKITADTAIRPRANALPALFSAADEYDAWRARISANKLKRVGVAGAQKVFLGVDSGSTTTKIVALNERCELLYSYYKNNGGNPVKTVAEGLREFNALCREQGVEPQIAGCCSTGYGEDLIKAAFQLDSGIIETIAHYKAAHHLNKNVSFILDIGGQDMKAVFVNRGIIDRIEINEACSSGCGSFIETFAKSMGFSSEEFAAAACRSSHPCDLGTRCTVFMNSKVKQVLREGATVHDIAAGLAYSVVKNCLYKVLKLKDASALGSHIVVQGGTMRNDAVVRAMELLTGATVTRCDCPELMGAFGCALYAMSRPTVTKSLDDLLSLSDYTTTAHNCKGCENRCLVQCYRFANGKRYYSGNRCEKAFSNGEAAKIKGQNAYEQKNALLFSRTDRPLRPSLRIGIPRVLNMFEEYPFWHTLFAECGIETVLSPASDYSKYEACARMVMSDNICFPAKLVHSHIDYLQRSGVDRIFMPFVIFENPGRGEQNSYNCPVVTGYSAVVKSVQGGSVPIDSPAISFKERDALFKQCYDYLSALGVKKKTIAAAFKKALGEQERFVEALVATNRRILEKSMRDGTTTILLAGRPYHADPLIQHKISYLLSEMGLNVITDDIVRSENISIGNLHFLPQWSYPNRIMKAARWCCEQGYNVQFVQLTSFGCGPDAFLTDEVRDQLMRHGKTLTLLKLDDINNVGSMKLRVRSLVESLKLSAADENTTDAPFVTTPIYTDDYRDRKILIPYFTKFISPLLPSILRVLGYNAENLPMSSEASCEWGLKYANNEVCYPATLIVGDIINAFKSGKYRPEESAVAITQTGGQCRASNYLPLIKKALVDAGYKDVPVLSLTMGGGISNQQPAFRINWPRLLPVALRAVLYSDCIAKFYYAATVREREQGVAQRLMERYLHEGATLIEQGNSSRLFSLLATAAAEFNSVCLKKDCPRVGIVGEIFLKFNPFAQKNIVDWLVERNIEVVPPILTDFFMQSFVNSRVKLKTHLRHRTTLDYLQRYIFKIVWAHIKKVNKIAASFPYYHPFENIFDEAAAAENVITLNAQFGEGWLLPAEIISYVRSGVNNVISLQPFGCIANHIVSRGVEKRIKTLYPEINLLSLDFDGGVSDVNIKNRLLLFIDKLEQNNGCR